MLKVLFVLAILTVSLVEIHCTYDGDSFKGSLEKSLNQAACYRLLSNEGDVGCRTPTSDESVGALFAVQSYEDIAAARSVDTDIVYVLSAQFLNDSILSELSRVKGVIVVDDSAAWVAVETATLSPDVQTPQGLGTPQENLSLNPEKVWNTHGNGISYQSYRFPIVRADPSENDMLWQYCSDNQRYGYSSSRVNVASFNFYMGRAGITSKDCLEWRNIYGNRSPQCMPLGGQSIWGTAGQLDSRTKVLGSIAIDSTAMFHDIAYGANDAAASIAAFLGAVEAIGRFNHHTLEHQIMFFAADADEWGYAGSRRFVKDIISFDCNNRVGISRSHVNGLPMCADPVYPSTLFERILHRTNGTDPEDVIKGGVALDQIGNAQVNEESGEIGLYLHSTKQGSKTADAVKSATGQIPGLTIQEISGVGLPPTPLTTFAKELGGLADESVVISGYGNVFSDPRYHSHYDNASHIFEGAVIRASELFAKSLVTMAGGDSSSLEVNETWVSEALRCLLSDWNCDFFSPYTSSEQKNMKAMLGYSISFWDGVSFRSSSGQPLSPPSYYSGVLSPYSGQPVVNRKGSLLGRFSGEWIEKEDIMYAIPSVLESIIRTVVSYHLGDKNALHFLSLVIGEGESPGLDTSSAAEGRESNVEQRVLEKVPEGETRLPCSVSSDCDEYFCELFSFEIPAVKLECLVGVCVCPVASYHLALDPGLAADYRAGQFNVLDNSLPIYTEPNWSQDVGVSIYPRTDQLTIYMTVGAGAAVVLMSLFYTCLKK